MVCFWTMDGGACGRDFILIAGLVMQSSNGLLLVGGSVATPLAAVWSERRW